MKILIVDNIKENIFFKELLENKNFHIEVALSSKEALKKTSLENYDLFILDIQMQEIDVFKLATQLKYSKKNSDVPIIFLTANNEPEDIIKGLKVGAIDYLTKPVNPDLLSLKISNLSNYLQKKSELEEIKRKLELLNKLKASELVKSLETEHSEKLNNIEAVLSRASNLENIGLLSRSIGHDLNNALSPVLMGIHLIRKSTPDEKMIKIISMVEASVNKGVNMIKQLLDFGRGAVIEKNKIDLKNIVNETVGIIKELLSKSISLQVSNGDERYEVLGDSIQLVQVLRELCLNARNSMPEGGLISISLSKISIPKINENFNNGKYNCISISDTGLGMSSELIEKIFDPSFIIKELGKETGTGLSTVFSIIKSHKGFIDINSRVGNGTDFKIYLPEVLPEDI